MLDSLQHKGRRKQLIDQLAKKYNFDPAILDAMNKVPRHMFLEYGLDHLAYLDKPLPIGAGQTISQPFTVAIQTQLLGLKKWEKVLEIGTGCAYQTAVLAQMGYRVYSIERQKSLYLLAQQNLSNLDYHTPVLYHGDGFAGLPKFAPFKGILITCGAPDVPEALLEQLAIGGKLVIPVGIETQTMLVVERVGQEEFRTTEHGEFKFVPMLGGTEN
ncbi:MAG: protein-L-isoaspartate(D-aspartate) O-methyltransferase [Bacteroidales bacterium]|nr:protein-L-isoaspartate(D-aspartate) O-methyltransferase [Bacteroidales bacterium]MDD2281377.1 protein-L-isoaspartate(D-aspartate) O-methyltransferase [Bacteroidales bacterium]MDD4293162.1 protein-L-isoaspartate(D-aspartate) O-methyltransferase [Bacteroidales bacterium]MDD4492342.1 protein-L-isoaspartate(D-aspartate) O-methyltransferase [Bacteroidales bacterium]HNW49108.1 protein-L-isoaspartate(D-aspartate) O-methyltransferase [Bacteroidales bacterium]